MVSGHDLPCLRPTLVKALLSGNHNLASLAGKGCVRAAVEPSDLPVIKANILTQKWSNYDKGLVYMTCLLLFYGSLRVHEVLGETVTGYDPWSTLTWADIRESSVYIKGRKVDLLTLSIKSPKEAKGKTVTVEIFANNSASCPLRAFRRLKRMLTPKASRNWPYCTRSNGLLPTGKVFNDMLKDITHGINKGPGGIIYIHKAPCLSVRVCVRPLRAKRAKLSPLQVLEFWARRALKF